MKYLIGLTGRTGSNEIARCGKDTVAEMINEFLPLPIYGFSDPIYEMVKTGLRY
jgi:dephospho-CoA kinase